jgi:hypothetical protein
MHVPCLCVTDVHGVIEMSLAVGTVVPLLEDWGECGELTGSAG